MAAILGKETYPDKEYMFEVNMPKRAHQSSDGFGLSHVCGNSQNDCVTKVYTERPSTRKKRTARHERFQFRFKFRMYQSKEASNSRSLSHSCMLTIDASGTILD
jgi:hypothetical protein